MHLSSLFIPSTSQSSGEEYVWSLARRVWEQALSASAQNSIEKLAAAKTFELAHQKIGIALPHTICNTRHNLVDKGEASCCLLDVW